MVLQVCDGRVTVYMNVYMYVILMYKHIIYVDKVMKCIVIEYQLYMQCEHLYG